MKKWLGRLAVVLCLITVVGVLIIYSGFRASLPTLDGSIEIASLNDKVILERDENGNATLTASDRNDLAFTTGYLHAQERFFQMDLARRMPAGELSELFGSVALNSDMGNRIHRFRSRATTAINMLSAENKLILDRYVDGVNSGLDDLGSKPFEYWILGAEPQDWQVEDIYLVIYSMFFTLQHADGSYEWNRHLIEQSMHPDIAKFLLTKKTPWDAPLQEDASPYVAPEIPSADLLKWNDNIQVSKSLNRDVSPMLGSSNWAVSGELTKTGGAMMSNDMHLSIRAPSIWYKLRMKLNDGSLDISGVSLPGTPLIVVGSNGSVAWGFTNTNIDSTDIIELDINPNSENQYMTKDGYKDFNLMSEAIQIKGSEAQELKIRETIWGPVMDFEDGKTYAYQWVAHKPEGASMGLMAMETVTTVAEAMEIASGVGIPAQNVMLADSEGNIGWTIFGMIPKRPPGVYDRIIHWSDPISTWDGWMTSDQYPRVYNPDHDRLWTANARVASGADLAAVGSSSYDFGARANQIKDDLFALPTQVTEKDLYDIQWDDNAVFLSRWQQQISGVLHNAKDDAFTPYLTEIDNWGAKADANSIGFRLVREYRNQVVDTLLGEITASCIEYDKNCNYDRATNQWEAPLWQIITDQPEGWLPPKYQSWAFFFEKMAVEAWQPVISGSVALNEYTWGAYNVATIRHPLSAAVPLLDKLTDMRPFEQSGDTENIPHISGLVKGQSERIVVSPGHEEQGIMDLPAGQSAHPLSPYYGTGHDDWLEGKMTPFLPQATKWSLEFTPFR
ncbi:MAG: penicillin acylase family protein [Kordiimonadaceae bacterium]|nr:penicillin acylase family protein [Kordiimonadaceae bacterium]MBT6032731.1 penicillin acylase family protein [Kordiimonadaceae bacterium]